MGMQLADIEMTQYVMPDGRQKQVFISRPKEIADAAAKVRRAIPGRFACEVLLTGQVSFTYENDEEDIDIEVCSNGPEVPGAVDRLVRRLEKSIGVPRGAL